MTARKRSIKSDLTRVDAHRITKAEYEEAPELTQEMLDRAEIRHGDKIVKRGRPFAILVLEPIALARQRYCRASQHAMAAAFGVVANGVGNEITGVVVPLL